MDEAAFVLSDAAHRPVFGIGETRESPFVPRRGSIAARGAEGERRREMSRSTSLVVLVIALLFLAATAHATVIVSVLSDNFDSYANQAAFEAAWPPIGTVAP